MPVSTILRASAVLAVVVAMVVSSIRLARARATIEVALDRRIRVIDPRARAIEGTVAGETCVGGWLVSIVWRRDGDSRWRPARGLLIVADMADADALRRLRVALRLGRPPLEAIEAPGAQPPTAGASPPRRPA